MANMLTAKEELFCLAIVDGKTQYEAYKIAYEPKTENRASIDTMAWNVARQEKIKKRIEELRNRRFERQMYKEILDLNRRYDLILERIEVCKEKEDETNLKGYVDMINKMTGTYINITKDITEETPLSKLSDEELKAILDSTE